MKMIWYDIKTLEPVAPGQCEDGGTPSIDFYWCTKCKTERRLGYLTYTIGCCEVCKEELLVRG